MTIISARGLIALIDGQAHLLLKKKSPELVGETKCRYCGAAADEFRQLEKRRRSFRRSHFYICQACGARHAERGHWRTLFSHVALGGAAAIWAHKDPSPGLPWFVLNLTALYFANIPATALHEAGHAITAVMARWRVYHIIVGWFGKPLFVWKIGGVKWQLNSIPIGGMAYVFPRDPGWFRVKAAFVYLGGPFINVAAALLCLTVADWPFSTFDSELHLLGAFGLANVVCAAVSLMPYRYQHGGGTLDTDGRAALRAVFRPGNMMRETMAGATLMEAEKLREHERYAEALRQVEAAFEMHGDNLYLQASKGLLLLDLERPVEARDLYLQMLQGKLDQPYARAMTLNNLAWADLMIGDSALLPEALEYSERAFSEWARSSAFQGTRGSVLVWSGQTDEGIRLLTEAFQSKDADHKGAALNASMIAVGEAQRGDLTESARWIEVAKRLHPRCALLPRAEAALQAAAG